MITNPLGRLVGFWRTDRGLSVFTLVLVLYVFVLPPLAGHDSHGLLAESAISVLLLSGVLALSHWKATKLVLLPLTLATMAIHVCSWVIEVSPIVLRLSAVLATMVLWIVILAQVGKRGEVTLHRIQGAVGAYLVLGLIWTHAYMLTALVRPEAFSAGAPAPQDLSGWIYFSFVTLTTLGYGDVAPLEPWARSLAIAEAVTGQLYVAIIMARLVSLMITDRRGKQARSE